MSRAIPIIDATRVHIARLEASRGARTAAREAGQAETERRFEAQKDEVAKHCEEMRHQIAAIEVQSSAQGIGGLLGAFSGVVMGLTLPVFAPVAGLSALGQALTSFAVHAGMAAGMGSFSGLTLMETGGKLLSPLSTYHENAATDARIGGDRAEHEAKGAEKAAAEANAEEAGHRDGKRTRGAIAEAQQADRVAREVRLNALAGRSASAQLSLPQGAAALVGLEQLQTLQGLQDTLGSVERGARRDAEDGRARALAVKERAADEQKSNAWWRCGIGLGELALDVAGLVVGTGEASVLLKAGGRGLGFAKLAASDDGVHGLQRKGEELELSSRRADAEADEVARTRRELGDEADRVRKVVAQQTRAVEGEGMNASGMPKISLGEIQKIRAQMAQEEAQADRLGQREAQEESFRKTSEAIESRRDGDTAENIAGGVQVGLAAIGLACSGVNSKGLDLALKGAEGLTNTVGHAFSSAAQREGEGLDLEAKRAADRADEAKSQAAGAQDAAKRALDATYEMQKNLAPRFA